MNKPSNIIREIPYSNGVVEIWVEYARRGKIGSKATRLWGYLYNGVKYTSYKKAKEAAELITPSL